MTCLYYSLLRKLLAEYDVDKLREAFPSKMQHFAIKNTTNLSLKICKQKSANCMLAEISFLPQDIFCRAWARPLQQK